MYNYKHLYKYIYTYIHINMYLQSAKSSNIIAHLSSKCCPRILPERLHRSVGRPNCSRAPAKCKMVQVIAVKRFPFLQPSLLRCSIDHDHSPDFPYRTYCKNIFRQSNSNEAMENPPSTVYRRSHQVCGFFSFSPICS